MKKWNIPPVYVLFSILLMTLLYFLLPDYQIIYFPLNFAGLPLCFAGFVLMGKSRDLFKKHQTTLAITQSTALIQEGVFSKSRNPMYIGMFLLLTGIGICFGNLLSILVPFIFILLVHFVFVLKEEKLMAQEFGPEYANYRKRVSRWI